jgi:Ca2+-binding EF-hand superfamily protein
MRKKRDATRKRLRETAKQKAALLGETVSPQGGPAHDVDAAAALQAEGGATPSARPAPEPAAERSNLPLPGGAMPRRVGGEGASAARGSGASAARALTSDDAGDEEQRVRRIFTEIDADGNGSLDKNEVQKLSKLLGESIKTGGKKGRKRLKRAFEEMKRMDPGGTANGVSVEGFLRWWSAEYPTRFSKEVAGALARARKAHEVQEAKAERELYLEFRTELRPEGRVESVEERRARLRRVFKKFDRDGSGALDLMELPDALLCVGAKPVSDRRLALTLSEISADDDDMETVTFDEFERLIASLKVFTEEIDVEEHLLGHAVRHVGEIGDVLVHP